MQPALEDARHRFEAELAPPAIELGNDVRVDQPAINQPPHRALHPHRQAGHVSTGHLRGLLMIRPEDRRREVKRRGRCAVDLLEHPRRKTQRVSNQDCPARLVRLGDARVVDSHHRRHRLKHQGQAVAAMPEIRMLRHAVEGFLRLRRDETESRALADAAERLRRQQRDVVASLTQRATDADERVNVAARADRREKKMRHSSVTLLVSSCARRAIFRRSPSLSLDRLLLDRVCGADAVR